MIHKLGYETQCETCGKACMFDDVNDEGECVACSSYASIVATGSAFIRCTFENGKIRQEHIRNEDIFLKPEDEDTQHGDSR